jgi:hypothetical protein
MSGQKVLIIEITEAGNEVVDVDHASDTGSTAALARCRGQGPEG